MFLCDNSPDSSKRCLVLSGIKGSVGISGGNDLGKKDTDGWFGNFFIISQKS